MNLIACALLLIASFSVVSGNQIYGTGCYLIGNSYIFDCGAKSKANPTCYCKSDAYFATVVDCIKRSAVEAGDVDDSISYISSRCKKKGKVSVKSKEILAAYNSLKDQLVPYDEVDPKKPTDKPIKLPDWAIQAYVKTSKTSVYELYSGTLFGGITVAYWALVLGIATVFNVLTLILPRLFHRVNSPLIVAFRKHFSVPATWGYKHAIPLSLGPLISMASPTRAQSLVLIGYGIVCFVLMMVNYNLFLPNYQFATTSLQLDRYLTDRAAIMACAQLPMMTIFATKNNILMLATGWTYDTFQVYHRWTGRALFMFSFIHAVGYSAYYTKTGTYLSQWDAGFWRWGVVALTIGSFLIFFSFRYFRVRFYDFFLAVHIVLSAVFMAAIWYHLKPHGYNEWLYAAIALWAFDRFVRILRWFYSGVTSKAEVQLMPGGVFKMKIDYSKRWKFYPGAYVYVHMLRPLKFWESHPFTTYLSPLPEDEGKLVLCCSAKAGITHHLRNYLETKENHKTSLRVLLDGPYGARAPVDKYDTAIFVSGGIGFTATYAYASDLIRRQTDKQNIIFLWVVRNECAMHWFDDEIKHLSQDPRVEIRIFISNYTGNAHYNGATKQKISEKDSSDSDSKDLSDSSSDVSFPSFHVSHNTRPDMTVLLPKFLSEATGTVGIVACGPPSLSDDVRRTVTDNLARPGGRIDYFEESFSW